MFKLGEVPSYRSGAVDLADFIELECLKEGDKTYSAGDLKAVFRKAPEPDEGLADVTQSDANIELAAEEAFREAADRADHSGPCVNRYPFAVRKNNLLAFRRTKTQSNWLYLFLLGATRLRMNDNRVHAGINGTELFESICAEVARCYFGHKRTTAVVFGTGRRSQSGNRIRFSDSIDSLCQCLGEGVGIRSNLRTANAKDDGLDIVAFNPFSDQRDGKLIGFGQCKTGTHWERHLFNLQPDGFCKKWLIDSPAVDPIRFYFITSRLRAYGWRDVMIDAGIVFDRCRILDYSRAIPDELIEDCRKWTKAAYKSFGIKSIDGSTR